MPDRQTTPAPQPDHADHADHAARARLLADAAGANDTAAAWLFTEVAHACAPDTVTRLAALLRGMRMAAPDHLGLLSVVAFIRYGHDDGVAPVRGTAITTDGSGYFNVHSVFFDDTTSRWEALNGRYDITWQTARDEMNRRAGLEPQP